MLSGSLSLLVLFLESLSFGLDASELLALFEHADVAELALTL